MGDIADAMINGELCEACGVPLVPEYVGVPNHIMGIPSYCSKACAKSRGADWWDEEDEEDEDRLFLDVLDDRGVKYICLSEQSQHYRYGYWDFWPTTGRFYNYKTKAKGYGVVDFLNIIQNIRPKVDQDPVEEIRRAWCDAGKRPMVHEKAKQELKRKWPTLFNALDKAFTK